MYKEFANFLVCLECRSDLVLMIAKEDSYGVESGILKCAVCSTQYPIRNYIPRMLSEADLNAEEQKVQNGFGFQWNAFPKIEPSDRDYFLSCIEPVEKSFLKDKVIMDAGCGMGRFSYISSECGSKMTVGVDFSSAIDAAWMNCKERKNIHLVQASLFNLPFKQDCFDYIYSLGVLHHLSAPEKGFWNLLPYLKAGGKISAWVYGREGNGWVTHLVTPLRRAITSRMPEPVLRPITFVLGCILYAAVKWIYSPVDKISSKLSKFLPYSNYLLVLRNDSFTQIRTVVFDQLHTPIAFYYTKEEFSEWFKKTDQLSDFSICSFKGYSWSGLGVKRDQV